MNLLCNETRRNEMNRLLINRLLNAANLLANDEAALLIEAAEALTRLTAGDVRMFEPVFPEGDWLERDNYCRQYAKEYADRCVAEALRKHNAAMTGPAGVHVHEPVLPKQTT
jgi:hypothetical protein